MTYPIQTSIGRMMHIRVALHGASDLGHHTVLKLNARKVLVDTVWGTSGNGMIDFLGEFSVDRSHLKDGRNRILLQVFADQAKFDLMWFNWFEIGYFRRYVSHLAISKPRTRPQKGIKFLHRNLPTRT